MKLKRNKWFTGTMAVLCAVAMLVVGTLALQGAMQLKNDFSGTVYGEPIIVEEFDPANPFAGKEVGVKNEGSAPAYARLNLSEFQEFSRYAALNKAPTGGVYTWVLHTPGANMTDCGHSQAGAAFHTGFDWTFSANTIPASTYNGTQKNVWIYDVDGWAYWSEPIDPDQTTGLFLTKVGTSYNNKDFYYSIDVGLEWADIDSLPSWVGDGTAANPGSITDPDIKDLFDGFIKKASNPDNFYEYRVTGIASSYTAGDTVSTPTVEYRAKGSQDAWVAATGISVSPTTIAANTTEVVVSFTTAKGTGTYTQPVSVDGSGPAPINPNNPLYDYRVTSIKSDYAVGDYVASNDLRVQYKLKVAGSWTNDTSATIVAVTPVSALTAGANNRTVTFTIGGNPYSQTLSLTVSSSQPSGVIGPMGNGKYYQQVAGENARVYQVVQQNGTGTGEYIYDTNGAIPANGASASTAGFQNVVHYTGPNIVFAATAFDPERIVTAKYFVVHSVAVYIPIYNSGVNYFHSVNGGTDGVLGGAVDIPAGVLPGDRTVPAEQQDNWMTR